VIGASLLSDDQQVRRKFIETGCHPVLILNLVPMFLHLDDATARVYDCLNVISNGPVVFKRWQPHLRRPNRRALE
jgi:hypothetical protein